MEGTFRVEIELGMAEMSGPSDVAFALRRVAQRLVDDYQWAGAIVDVNGNRVGRFDLES